MTKRDVADLKAKILNWIFLLWIGLNVVLIVTPKLLSVV